ncbi:hypothetical protein SPRG_07049 [Saprolegnia parasitica CBS 223.65]|uniref:RanBP2-type domain-containing protein n=1 Tax=Saprolegnia parasitica (strain CBS 223.65) TaxID=695850 RepID=A0A067CE51_SAPPC|nr:hypothetical protein SPRG_07049 [Saprolegnia parasitica CBS 223.65]KDO27460.1 hypothetical protein SPRG_07049 [Saprolegnia parasitica CBS 223.65]|eukprot:XP_012201898.1 hypothetical protein SPRG_07049 [Saprolegnia parasitica CBS 223.65]
MNRQRRQRPPPNDAGHRHGHTVNGNIRPGMRVAVVQKQDQPTGKLTYGTVATTLTNSALHPRGIKVRLTDGIVGRVQLIVHGEAPEPAPEPDAARPTSRLHLQDFIQAPSPPKLQLHDFIEYPATSEREARPWACAACTFENSGFLVACEVCETPKTL